MTSFCAKPKARKNLAGQVFGRLTVTGVSSVRNASGFVQWNCVCSCNTKVRVRTAALINGNTRSCGCLKINHLRGRHNYQAQRMLKDYGVWIHSRDPWYVRGVQVWGRIKKDNIPSDFRSPVEVADHLRSIAPKTCPVFGKRLTTGHKKMHDWSPSADKIDPDKGYVRGNIQVISMFANRMKQNATCEQLLQFALWIMKTFWNHKMVGQSRNFSDVNLTWYALRLGYDLTQEECEEIRNTTRKGYTVARAVTEYVEKKENGNA